uniref:Uncharacterized protein n=1 Tax=Heterorhabditis bacteriophora TaxID=37862 RepID=A0A1I7WR61_HETBA
MHLGQPYSTNIECPIDIEDLNLCPDGKDCSMTLWSKRSGLHTGNALSRAILTCLYLYNWLYNKKFGQFCILSIEINKNK